MVPPAGLELILGSSVDPQFGPVILFGLGGRLVEVFRDRALALPPLNGTLARRMMEQTRVYHALDGFRGRAGIDRAALEQLVVRFSQFVVEQRAVREVDINPLLATAGGRLIALDARIVLYGREVTDERLPRPAVRPYPTQYVWAFRTRGGSSVTVRPIRPDDEPLIVRFQCELSDESIHYRYGSIAKLSHRVAHDRMVRSCFTDYDRHIALVAEHRDPVAGGPEIVGVGRLVRTHGVNEAEFSVVVADHWQGRGLGSRLIELLVEVARAEGLAHITGYVLRGNERMLKVRRKLGMRLAPAGGDLVGDWIAELTV